MSSRAGEFSASADKRRQDGILTECLGSRGIPCNLAASVGFVYGWNAHGGENVFATMDSVVLDVCGVRIGDSCMVGPCVSLLTAARPIVSGPRAELLESDQPIGNEIGLGGHGAANPGDDR